MSNSKTSTPKSPTTVYAFHPNGQRIKIPLVSTLKNQRQMIETYLLNAGIGPEEINNTTFSTTNNGKNVITNVSTTSDGSSKIASEFVNAQTLDPSQRPAIPIPTSATQPMPMISMTSLIKFVPLTDLKSSNMQFCLYQNGKEGKRNIFDFEKSNFKKSSDYNKLYSGDIGFSARLVWMPVDEEILYENDELTSSFTYQRGTSHAIRTAVSTTIGASYGGVSAEVTASFEYDYNLTENTLQTQEIKLKGKSGKIIRQAYWQLCEIIRFEEKDSKGNYKPLNNYRVEIKGDCPNDPYIWYSLDPQFFSSQLIGTDNNNSTEKIVTSVISRTPVIQRQPTSFDAS